MTTMYIDLQPYNTLMQRIEVNTGVFNTSRYSGTT